VYGVTTVPSSPKLFVSMLSPVPQSLGIETSSVRLAATSERLPTGDDLTESAWIYFLR
jgi:hypothetical protein